MMRLIAFTLLAALATAAAGDPAARAGRPYTLRAAVEEALAANPAAARSTAGRDAAAAGLGEARSAWLPRVGASATFTRSDNPVFVFGSLLEQGRFSQRHFDPAFLNDPDPLSNTRLALDVRYALFDQWRRRDAIRQAGNGVSRADLAAEESAQLIRAQTVARFYGLMLAEESEAVAADAVRTAEAAATVIRDRFDQGLTVESDVLAAEVHLASLRQRRIDASGQVAVARAALAVHLGRHDEELLAIRPASTRDDLAVLPLQQAVAEARSQRGEVRIAELEAADRKLQIETTRNSRLPRLDAFGSFGASNGDSDSTLGLSLAIDVFDSGRASRVARSRAAHADAVAIEAAARDSVTMQVVSAWHRVQAARERITVASAAVAQSETAARIVRDRYEQGLTIITEELRAQTALVSARLELLNARYDHLIGHAELTRAIGGLHDVSNYE